MLALAAASAALLAGHSVEGRPIRAVRSGPADAPIRVLVVGSLHGDEPAGHRITHHLRATGSDSFHPQLFQVWTLRTANPDAVRRGTRTNARGVDLNRNFAHRWRPGPRGRYHPGPRKFSEPESRAVRRLVKRVRPHLTVYYHQPYGFVVDTPTARRSTLLAYARRAGMPLRRLPRYRGTAVGWQRKRFPRSESMVVELGATSAVSARRHVRALVAAARRVARRRGAHTSAARRPRFQTTPIPFGRKRKRQMRRYAVRHYGIRSFRLTQPRTIVQHYTASSTFSSAWNTFAANARDTEMGELPGVCAHFLIDRDGTIHRLVRTRLMCRHTIGLNHRSIGIEHVGTSDAQVMGNRRQLRASLRLTRWLMTVHDIPRRHVIGHAESLSSPFHRERVRHLRERTHGDFPRTVMRRYRARL